MFTRVSAAKLRTWGPLVRQDAIRAGDVVLSRGQGAESTAIARLTRGPYSHAAIFLPYTGDRTVEFKGVKLELKDHLDLAEADDEGVDGVPPRPLMIIFGGARYPVIRLSGKRPPKAAVVLRHPKLHLVDNNKLMLAVEAFKAAHLVRRYSSTHRLPGALPLPRLVRQAISRALLVFPKPERPVLEGCFCSELVVRFYQCLGLELFTGGPVIAEETSPNHLAQSCLGIVSSAVFTKADIPDDAYGEVMDLLQKDLRSDPIDPKAARRGSKLRRKRRPDTYVSSRIKVEEFMQLEVPKRIKDLGDAAAETLALERLTQGVKVHRTIETLLSDQSMPSAVLRMFDALYERSAFLIILRDHLYGGEALPENVHAALGRLHDRQIVALTDRLVRAAKIAKLPPEESVKWRKEVLAKRLSKKAQRAAADDDIDASVRAAIEEVRAKTKAVLRASRRSPARGKARG